MNIYKELFENWIPDIPGSGTVIHDTPTYHGFKDFYMSFHNDYGPAFTISTFIIMGWVVCMWFRMFLPLHARQADKLAKYGMILFTVLFWVYIFTAMYMGYSSEALLQNNGMGMLSRMFYALFLHVPIAVVGMLLFAAISASLSTR